MPVFGKSNMVKTLWDGNNKILKKFRSFFLTLSAFFGLCLVMVNVAQALNQITDLRIGKIKIEEDWAFRLVIETAAPLQANLSLLREPYRLVIDVDGASWQVASLPPKGELDYGLASSYRFGLPKKDIGRLVIELNEPAVPVRAFALPPTIGDERFVIDLVEVGSTAFMVAAAALRKNPNLKLPIVNSKSL